MIDTTENFPVEDNFPAEDTNAAGTAAGTENAPAENRRGDTTQTTISVAGMQGVREENGNGTARAAASGKTENAPAGDANDTGTNPPAKEDDEVEDDPSGTKFESLINPEPMPAGQILLEARGLVKAYHGRVVVNQVNLSVHCGEIVGLLGPNGAGKTTSFYMVTGLIKPNAGEVFFKGVDVSHFPMYVRARMGMGYLAQEPSIFRKLSVEDNILAILQTLDISYAERKARLEDLLSKLELTHLRKQKAMTLSGGERRRLEITRALVTNPSFIMLDEPFSGVDPIVVYEIQKIIRKLRDMGLGILITDHNVRETLSCVDRAYLMADGKVCLEGSSDFLINSEEARKIYLGPAFVL